MERVLRSFELAQDGRGRRAYAAWLEARAANAEGKIDEEAMQAIRRGWYLGKESFKDRLLKLLEKSSRTSGGTRNRTGEALRDHGEKEAERIVRRAVKVCGLPSGAAAMAKLPKGDGRKVALASLLRERTSVSNGWIAARLAMGHPGSVSRLLGSCRVSREWVSTISELEKAIDEG